MTAMGTPSKLPSYTSPEAPLPSSLSAEKFFVASFIFEKLNAGTPEKDGFCIVKTSPSSACALALLLAAAAVAGVDDDALAAVLVTDEEEDDEDEDDEDEDDEDDDDEDDDDDDDAAAELLAFNEELELLPI